MNSSLLPQKATIYKQVAADPSDEFGLPTEVIIASNVLCRIDSLMRYNSRDTISPATIQVIKRATIFLEANTKTVGIPPPFDEESWLIIDGEKWEIEVVHAMRTAASIDHYELFAVQKRNI